MLQTHGVEEPTVKHKKTVQLIVASMEIIPPSLPAKREIRLWFNVIQNIRSNVVICYSRLVGQSTKIFDSLYLIWIENFEEENELCEREPS